MSDLAAVSSRIIASVVIGTKPHLIGIDLEGRQTWQREVADPALLIAGHGFVFAVFPDGIEVVDPVDGIVGARRSADPPSGGWTRATTLSIGDDLLVADAGGVERLRAVDLESRWKVTPAIDDGSDSVQQLVYGPPWIAAVSKRTVMVITERGELTWSRRLPAETRLAGDSPLALADPHIWVGLVRESDPRARTLYQISLSDGRLESETSIDDLAMFCPAHIEGDVLVMDTQRGLAGFEIINGLRRRWSMDVPVATGASVRQNGHLFVATRDGEVLRVTLADGRRETLIRLPRKSTWVPPAPDVSPGVHDESTGEIRSLALLPGGVVFSASWSRDRAVIQFRPW